MISMVCGAGGFIGGHLVADLLRRGEAVVAIDIKPLDQWSQIHSEALNVSEWDLSDRDSCYGYMYDIGTVYNLAADMGGIGYIENNKALCMLSVLINTHLLMAANDCGVQQFFYSSSACVYAAEKQLDPGITALKESDAYPAMPEDGYGWEKLFSERMCRHFREDFGFPTWVARFHNVYGPLGTYDGGREKAPAAICRKVIEAKLSGSHEITIWGDGEQTRSFMWIGDCIEGISRIVGSPFWKPVNLGSSELVTVNQLVDLAEEIAGIKLNRSYDLTAPQGVRGRNSDNSLIVERLGWEPHTLLRGGLERTYRWIYDEMTR